MSVYREHRDLSNIGSTHSTLHTMERISHIDSNMGIQLETNTLHHIFAHCGTFNNLAKWQMSLN